MKEVNIDKLKDYLSSRDEVVAAYLFGSYAKEKSHPKSDIDIALLLNPGLTRDGYGIVKLNIIADSMGVLSFNAVDVVILNDASPLLSHEVIKKGRLLFSKDEKVRLEFTVKATKRYLDTIHLRRVQDKILHEKIRRGDFGYFKGSHKYSIETVRKGTPGTPAVK